METFKLYDKHKKRIIELINSNVLQPRETQIIKMRFGLDGGDSHTLEEVGREFGVTRERIRQIEMKAIEKLNKHF